MSCPTCSHTLSTLSPEGNNYRYALCPRCGTVTQDRWAADENRGEWLRIATYVPKLVERCRQLPGVMRFMPLAFEETWHRLGIAEAINTPENRS